MSDAQGIRNLFADRLLGPVQTERVDAHFLSDKFDVLFLATSRN